MQYDLSTIENSAIMTSGRSTLSERIRSKVLHW